MATLYLCIGTMKTGTTSLQNFMLENPEALEKQGYCYPFLNDLGMGFDLTVGNGHRNGHFLIFKSKKKELQKKQEEEAEVKRRGYQKLEELAGKFPNIVLSEELIWHHCYKIPNFWQDLQENLSRMGCKLKVIVYLRRQDELVQSFWNQGVKLGVRLQQSFEFYVRTKKYDYFPMDYYSHLKYIEENIGKDNLIVRIYENGQFEGESHTLLSDYLGVLGIRLTEDFVLGKNHMKRNPSLSGNFIEMKRIINGVPEYRAMSDFMTRPVLLANLHQEKAAKKEQQSLFTYEQQEAFLKEYEESNQKVAKEFLGREDGILFREPLGRQPVYQVDYETLYWDLLTFMTEMFCMQKKQLDAMQEQIDGMQKVLKLLNNGWFQKGYRKLKSLKKR